MKKFILFTGIMCIALTSTVNAQESKLISFAERFMQTFKGHEDDFSVVRISPQMLSMISKMSDEKSVENEFLKKLKGLYILSYDMGNRKIIQNFDQQMKTLLKDYESLMEIKDGKDKVQMLTKMEGGKITDFVMLVNSLEGFTFINFFGEIDLSNLSKLQTLSKAFTK